MSTCESRVDEDYYICNKTHHDAEQGTIVVSVHDKISEAMHITSANVVFYDVLVRRYTEQSRKIGYDIVVRRQQSDESMKERDSYRFIPTHENIESASKNIQQLIETETPLIREQSIKAAGLVSEHISNHNQKLSLE